MSAIVGATDPTDPANPTAKAPVAEPPRRPGTFIAACVSWAFALVPAAAGVSARVIQAIEAGASLTDIAVGAATLVMWLVQLALLAAFYAARSWSRAAMTLAALIDMTIAAACGEPFEGLDLLRFSLFAAGLALSWLAPSSAYLAKRRAQREVSPPAARTRSSRSCAANAAASPRRGRG